MSNSSNLKHITNEMNRISNCLCFQSRRMYEADKKVEGKARKIKHYFDASGKAFGRVTPRGPAFRRLMSIEMNAMIGCVGK